LRTVTKRWLKISDSDELLTNIFTHDMRTPLTVVRSSIEMEEIDKVGFSELPEDEQEEVREALETLEDAYQALEDGRPLEGVKKELRELSGYRGQFGEEVGRHFDAVGELSAYVMWYLDEFDDSKDKDMMIGDFMTPLEERDVHVVYNGKEEAHVRGDPGLCLVTNTVAGNGIKHGKEDENYQMWAEVEELPDSYGIDIWDNGPGIPEEYSAEQILEKGVGDGTGKGLNYASRIVDLFDGDLYHSEELQERENGYGLRIELKKPEEA
jgi:signal transduction histidine kinase